MTDEGIANQTVYVRLSTKKALMLLTNYLPPQDVGQIGRRGKSTQDDAIRFLLKKVGIKPDDEPDAQVIQVSKAVRGER